MQAGLLAAAAALSAVLLHAVQPLSSVNARMADLLVVGSEAASPVLIAAIDDATLDRYGRLADWDRSLHARALANLTSAGARVVAFDVLFAEAAPGDAAFAAALRASNSLLAAGFGGEGRPEGPGATDDLLFRELLGPHDALSEAAPVAHANLTPDPDGVVRAVPLVAASTSGERLPSLAYAAFARFFRRPPSMQIPTVDDRAHLLAPLAPPLGRLAPIEANWRLRVSYHGPTGSLERLSYADVIENRFDPALVANRAVLIGLTVTGAHDTFPTSFGGAEMPGVEVHANVLDQLFASRWLVRSPPWTVVLGEALALALLALAVARGSTKLVMSLGPALLLAGFLAVIAAAGNRVLVEPLYPALVLALGWVLALGTRLLDERAERQTIHRLFGRYVSPAVAAEVGRRVEAGELSLGGERREMTAMFADIRSFTSFTAEVEPEIAMQVVNEIMRVLIREVDAHGGFVNKFSGDGMLAVWNVPNEHPEHAAAAVSAAVQALAAWKTWRGSYPGLAEVVFAVGVHSGPAVAGILGTEDRSEYTVIGDTVNMAARLCAAAPGGSVWVSEAVACQLIGTGTLRDEGWHSFKGSSAPMRVWSLTPEGVPTPATAPVAGVRESAADRVLAGAQPGDGE